jgi:predicted acetyltransferase
VATFEEVFADRVDEWNAVLHWVYDQAAPTEPASAFEPGERRFQVRADGRAVSACRVRAYTVARGPADLACGGVAAVGTLVEARRSRHADALMRGVLDEMHRAGTAVSALYPFRRAYYEKFGYAACGWKWQIECPVGLLPDLDSPLPVRRLEAGEWPLLVPAYEAFARARSGCLVRREAEWARRVGGEGSLIYAVGEPVRGYCIVRTPQWWGAAEVSEFVYDGPEGYAGLVGVFRALGANQERVRWNEPVESPMVARHMERGVSAQYHGQTMFRVTDVVSAIRSLRPPGEGEFTMEVLDPELPGNAGCWKVRWRDGAAEAGKGQEAGFTIPVGALSQAVMGCPSFATSLRQGAVQVRSAKDADAAERFFGAMPVSMVDTF